MMSTILKYRKRHELELISLLSNEPDWRSFTNEEEVGKFKKALLNSETFVCESNNEVCGYIRAMIDDFGIYISELYVAPSHRRNGYGRRLLNEIKSKHPDQDVYVLSDEDWFYEALGIDRIGSVFKL